MLRGLSAYIVLYSVTKENASRPPWNYLTCHYHYYLPLPLSLSTEAKRTATFDITYAPCRPGCLQGQAYHGLISLESGRRSGRPGATGLDGSRDAATVPTHQPLCGGWSLQGWAAEHASRLLEAEAVWQRTDWMHPVVCSNYGAVMMYLNL